MSSDNSAVPKLRSADVIWLAASPADEASKGLNIRLVARFRTREKRKKKKRRRLLDDRLSKYRE
jgi:hypothetical protein